jgi:hypothetical protein
MNTISINLSQLNPDTIASIIADLLGQENTILTVGKLVESLEILVGEEESISYLNEVSITPEDLAQAEEYA